MNGEGHFCTLLRKGQSKDAEMTVATGSQHGFVKSVKLTAEEEDFLTAAGFRAEKLSRVELHGDKLFLIPAGLPDMKGLRLLRNGLYLGDRKKNRFEPSQPLAMALTRENAPSFLDLPVDDPLVTKYLKCETLELPEEMLFEADGKKSRKSGEEFSGKSGEKSDKKPDGGKWDNGMTLIGMENFPLGWGKRNGTTVKNKYFSGWRMM